MAAYQTFETQAIYQAIHDLALWLTPHVGKWPKWIRPTLGHQAMESVLLALVERGEASGKEAVDSLRSWFSHLSHADTYRLRAALWSEAKVVLGEYIC